MVGHPEQRRQGSTLVIDWHFGDGFTRVLLLAVHHSGISAMQEDYSTSWQDNRVLRREMIGLSKHVVLGVTFDLYTWSEKWPG